MFYNRFIFIFFLLLPGHLFSQAIKPQNIIIIVAGGLGISQITAAAIANGDTLNLERFDHAGFMKNYTPSNFSIEITTGTYPLASGLTVFDSKQPDTLNPAYKTFFDLAREKNKSTGMITSGLLSGSSLTPFYSYRPYVKEKDKLIKDLVYSDLTIFIGGGRKYFRELAGNDYIKLLEEKEYKIIDDFKGLKKKTNHKVAAMVDRDELKPSDKRGDYFELAWQKAFKTLVKDKNGYLLIIENPHIEWAAQKNEWRYLTNEIIDLDKTIGKILNYVQPDNKTLVIVVSPYEIGGLTINDGNLIYKHLNPRWSSRNATATLSPVFATGPGAELFTGIYQNTDFYYKIISLLNN